MYIGGGALLVIVILAVFFLRWAINRPGFISTRRKSAQGDTASAQRGSGVATAQTDGKAPDAPVLATR